MCPAYEPRLALAGSSWKTQYLRKAWRAPKRQKLGVLGSSGEVGQLWGFMGLGTEATYGYLEARGTLLSGPTVGGYGAWYR